MNQLRMNGLVQALLAIIFLPAIGAAGTGPLDDGQDYTSDDTIVNEAVRRDWELRRKAFVDYGDQHKVIIVNVTDEAGNPISTATMDVHFYGESRGQWNGLPASQGGEISAFAPGYFGPMRIEIWLIRAPGFRPRMLKNYCAGSSESDVECQMTQKEWEQMLASYAKGPGGSPAHLAWAYRNDPEKKVVMCKRKIILRKQ